MSVPTGSDASTAAEESNDDRSGGSAVETVRRWASHWRAWAIAALSLAVVGWAAFLQPQASPKGYIPIFLGFAALAVGFVYLDEETQIEFASG